ncbi:MAG: molybdenum cofactor guanylyltransferase, partial [Aldersonia sp.]|nr:molybdenum cofactor guanylyltransferase [Aldersonia sp.]
MADTMPDPTLSAAVLAGGMSSRMGTDKALMPLRPGDPPLARLVVDRVRQVAEQVFVVSNERPGYDAFGVPVVPDRYPTGATLGGIATALEAATAEYCLVVACDMPFLEVDLLRWMAGQPRDYDALVPRVPGESRQGSGYIFQTLHAIYRKSCLPAIRNELEAGRRQVIGFFPSVEVRTIEADSLRRFDPD